MCAGAADSLDRSRSSSVRLAQFGIATIGVNDVC